MMLGGKAPWQALHSRCKGEEPACLAAQTGSWKWVDQMQVPVKLIPVSRFCMSSAHSGSSVRGQACKRSASDAPVLQFPDERLLVVMMLGRATLHSKHHAEEKRQQVWLHRKMPGCLNKIQDPVKWTLASKSCISSRHSGFFLCSQACWRFSSAVHALQLPEGRAHGDGDYAMCDASWQAQHSRCRGEEAACLAAQTGSCKQVDEMQDLVKPCEQILHVVKALRILCAQLGPQALSF